MINQFNALPDYIKAQSSIMNMMKHTDSLIRVNPCFGELLFRSAMSMTYIRDY